MKYLLLLLLPLFCSGQTYIGLKGDMFDDLPSFGANVQHDINKFGGNVYYMFREGGMDDVQALGLQATWKPFTASFYTPLLLAGAEVLPKVVPSYGIQNLFQLDGGVQVFISFESIDSKSYVSIGIVLQVFKLEKDFKPRFF